MFKKLSYKTALLLTLIVIELFVFIPVQNSKSPAYPTYLSAINSTTWFTEMFNDVQPVFHSMLNRSTWFLYGWNITSVQSVQANYRTSIAHYAVALIVEYELTGNQQYLYEAKWIVDRYLALEGTVNYAYTWFNFYPAVTDGFIHHDVWVWMAMQKLNEHGFNYNVTGRVDSAINVAMYNNSTDLGWETNYYAHTGLLAYYVLDDMMAMTLILNYLNYKGVKDYSAQIVKNYNAIERFRYSNKYKYILTDGTYTDFTTLTVLSYMLLGEKYSPTVINNTKIQATLDAFSYNDLHGFPLSGYIALLARNQSFTLSDQWKRLLRLQREMTFTGFSSRWEQNYAIKPSKWSSMNSMTWTMASLSLILNTSVTSPAITDQVSSGIHYSSAWTKNLSNNVVVYGGESGTRFPDIMFLDGAMSMTHVAISQVLTAVSFDTTTNSFHKTNYSYDGKSLTLDWDKFETNFNFTASGSVRWKSMYTYGSFAAWEWRVILSNGTVIQMANENKVWDMTPAWAIEIKTTANSAQWILFQTSNQTLTQVMIDATKMYLWNSLTSFKAYWMYERIDILDANAFTNMRSQVVAALVRLQNGQRPYAPESIAPKTQSRIVHSDANISNYVDYALTSGEMNFTLTYPTGQTSVTHIYAGDIPQPSSITGVSSWNYSAASKFLTLVTSHTTSAKAIAIKWTTIKDEWGHQRGDAGSAVGSGPGFYDGKVDALDLHYLATVFSPMPYTDYPMPNFWRDDWDTSITYASSGETSVQTGTGLPIDGIGQESPDGIWWGYGGVENAVGPYPWRVEYTFSRSPPTYLYADFNYDHRVDALDLMILATYWGMDL